MPRANLSPDTVIHAARDLVDAGGADALSMSALARRLGVRTASLYGHVRDLGALRGAVQALILDELADAVDTAIDARTGPAALEALADAQREYAFARPARWSLIQQPVSPDERTTAAASRMASHLLDVVDAYGISAGQRVHAVRFVSGALAGSLALEAADAFAHRNESTDASWRHTIAALDRALDTWPSELPA
ncbi:TetR/AcrR family transcriptional regulator [Microbacterium dauci]|uniref:WHG domain-containing protein n=1 Tax=Microbacterium dauci TaxID=3048008 RepID=A0ABT6ZAD8_9MICO|nr:TetR/AcrR family transcriptional regulator [Microbacterium sp. LX3-4]MDJ1113122.1 WHG domain-containing protein [Microbacterium sp. LX3-4]